MSSLVSAKKKTSNFECSKLCPVSRESRACSDGQAECDVTEYSARLRVSCRGYQSDGHRRKYYSYVFALMQTHVLETCGCKLHLTPRFTSRSAQPVRQFPCDRSKDAKPRVTSHHLKDTVQRVESNRRPRRQGVRGVVLVVERVHVLVQEFVRVQRPVHPVDLRCRGRNKHAIRGSGPSTDTAFGDIASSPGWDSAFGS